VNPVRWRVLRLLLGAAILVALVQRLGSEPVMQGLRATSLRALALALVVTAGTTWCCSRRWFLVGQRLGDPVSATAAYPAYYRSQVINATMPLGVVGDVHRGIRHGLRAVVWERGLGQLVQAVLTIGVLVLLPSAAGWTAGPVLLVTAGCAVVVAVAARRQLGLLLDVGLLARVALLSTVAVAGHLLLFLVAARTAGVTLPLTQLVPLGALVLLASAVPTNVGGWGPREGMAAWVFAEAGLGADVGLAVAVTFGVMSLVATLPGLFVLISPRVRRVPRQAGAVEVGHG
jgi:uncharacterized membrane protein YbhN (UPF0104 family)